MRILGKRLSRRELLLTTAGVAGIGLIAAACGDDDDDDGPAAGAGQPSPTATTAAATEVHGVCFMPDGDGGDCKSYYQDLGVVEREGPDVIALYTFPASGSNPLDTGGNYGPERLQNNVFATGGRFWKMFTVESATLSLIAGTDGSVELASTKAGGGAERRDLTTQPYTSEATIMQDADAGLIVVTDTGMVVDCPVTQPGPEATIVDLNPSTGDFCEA